MKKYIALAALAVATVAVVSNFARPGRAFTAVQAAPAKPAPAFIVASGRTEPASEEIDAGAEISGRLRRVHVDEGQAVRRGQVIAELENADFQARVDLARAAVAERAAALDRAHNGARPMQKRESSAQVREAEAVLANARAERDRRASLLDRGAISRSEFDTADREFHVAQARVDAARERLALTEEEVRPEDVARVRAELDQAKARLAEAEAMLAKTVIRAPITGVVLRKHRNTGESVSIEASPAIVTLGDTSRMRVRVEIDENDVARVSVGQSGWVTANAYGDRKFAARVIRVGKLLGLKQVRGDAPSERVDTKVLETMLELEDGGAIPAGLRVDAYLATKYLSAK